MPTRGADHIGCSLAITNSADPEFEVDRPVVVSLTVLVMDRFSTTQGPAELLFHHVSMFSHWAALSPRDSQVHIAARCHVSVAHPPPAPSYP
jgi:hypothetical protein